MLDLPWNAAFINSENSMIIICL